MLTTLFPINIVPINLFGSSKSFSTLLAFLTFSLTICLSLILLSDSNAVSEAEKKADAPIKTIKNNPCQ